MSSLRISFLKAVLPTGVYYITRTYIRRLVTWKRLIRQVHGVTARDRLWLWGSFLASPLTAARGLSEWRDPVLLRDIVADVSGVGRFGLRARTDDLWHVVPFRECAVLEYIRTRLRPGDCFVDAGANIGFYTIAGAKAVGLSGTVIAVEMVKGTADILRDHIRLNAAGAIRVIEGALSTREGDIAAASMPSGSYGQASISVSDKGETFEVRTTTFNSVLRDVPSVRLIKMDIEGAELEALKGSTGALERVEAIIFEHVHTRDFEEIHAVLTSHGFSIDRLDGSNSLASRH
jgi:FkbM family methyltransferase